MVRKVTDHACFLRGGVAIGSLGHVELFGVGVDDLGREGRKKR